MNYTSTIPVEDILSYEKLLHIHYFAFFLGLIVACLWGVCWMHKNLSRSSIEIAGAKFFLVLITIVWFAPFIVINYFTLLELYVAPEIFMEDYSLDSPIEQQQRALQDMGCIETFSKMICNGKVQ